jgi:hypothetical protein
MVLTTTMIQDGERDLTDLGMVVNGGVGASPVITRTGTSIRTIARVIADAEAAAAANIAVIGSHMQQAST